MLLGHDAQAKEMKRRAKDGSIAHANLFYGPGRVGKRSFAEALARHLEYGVFLPEQASSPILGDALMIRPEEGTIGIDAARGVRRFLSELPNRSAYRTVVVDDADLLTTEAQNALLKVAEEPSSKGLLILVTHDPGSLLPTLRSRLEDLFFGPASQAKIKDWLMETHKLKAMEAKRFAEASRGAPGLAWSLAFDEDLKARLVLAESFIKTRGSKEVVAELIEDEAFNLANFMELLMIVAAQENKYQPKMWHAFLDLRRDASITNPNPRLQLTALARSLV